MNPDQTPEQLPNILSELQHHLDSIKAASRKAAGSDEVLNQLYNLKAASEEAIAQAKAQKASSKPASYQSKIDRLYQRL